MSTLNESLLTIQPYEGVQMHLMHYLLVTIDPPVGAVDFINRLAWKVTDVCIFKIPNDKA